MKKPLILFALLFPAGARASAQDLRQANRLYQEARYAQAAESYQALLRAKPKSAILHFNLANAYYKEGSPGRLARAIALYWKAFSLNPRDPDIRHNLDFALHRAGESLVPEGTPAGLHVAFYLLSKEELLGLQWIGYWCALLLGSLYLLADRSRERIKPWLAASVAFWAVFGSWWSLRKAVDIPNPAVILQANAEARSGPGRNFPVAFNVPEGRRVSVMSKNANWLEIGTLKEGLKGWVSGDAVQEL